MDHRDLLPNIAAPTLVIAGRHDPATTLEANQFVCNHIPGAKLVVLDAAHVSNVEQPTAYSVAALQFLTQRPK
jgi:3-oxoadipate enol-lactonase